VGGGQRNADGAARPARQRPRRARRQRPAIVAIACTPRGGYVDVDTTARPGKPEIEVAFDRQRAADVGVQGFAVARTVRGLIAGEVATEFEDGGERYDVRVRLPGPTCGPRSRRSSARRCARSAARSSTSPTSAASSPASARAASTARRGSGRSRSSPTSKASRSATALEEVGGIANELLSPDITACLRWHQRRLMQESLASMLFALLLAIICVYMILASQFESFAHPFTIMMSLPFALIGAFGGLLITGHNMSIFAMIGLIMLMGLVTKNAILLVDFANQLRGEGKPLAQALEDAGAVRLRPILMTTAAMIFGMLPVAIGHGDGGEVRAPMGVVVIGGLITSTVLTLVVVPVVYALMEGLLARLSRLRRRVFGSGHAEPEMIIAR
jgi:HAE1 family hydrophobic/amphiphilic exporter-1